MKLSPTDIILYRESINTKNIAESKNRVMLKYGRNIV